MGVIDSQLAGGFTPICNSCGIRLCWDISRQEYDERPQFWEDWKCRDCRQEKDMNDEEIFEHL